MVACWQDTSKCCKEVAWDVSKLLDVLWVSMISLFHFLARLFSCLDNLHDLADDQESLLVLIHITLTAHLLFWVGVGALRGQKLASLFSSLSSKRSPNNKRLWSMGDPENIWSAIKIRSQMPCSNAMLHAPCISLSSRFSEPSHKGAATGTAKGPKGPKGFKALSAKSTWRCQRRCPEGVTMSMEDMEQGVMETRRHGRILPFALNWCFSSTCSSSTAARESASTAATPSSIRRSCKKLPSLRSKLCIWSNSFRI